VTEALVPTKEHPAPLDAFETAKADEPIWTVQGGDPLGPPLLRLWAIMARVRAGIASPNLLAQWLSGVKEVAESHSVKNDQREVDNLLVRATATEEISWAMDDYACGRHRQPDKPTEAVDTHLDELERIDLHDARVKASQRINNMVAELAEIDEALIKHDFTDARCANIHMIISELKNLGYVIEPRRIVKERTPQ
jgi:hypothetical protein